MDGRAYRVFSVEDAVIKIKSMLNDMVKDDSYREITDEHNAIHDMVQERICRLSKEYGLRGSMEYNIYGYVNDERDGRIDIMWYRDQKPFVAIELDFSLRKKSIAKLLSCDAEYRIWVYCGKKALGNFMYNNDPGKHIALAYCPL